MIMMTMTKSILKEKQRKKKYSLIPNKNKKKETRNKKNKKDNKSRSKIQRETLINCLKAVESMVA